MINRQVRLLFSVGATGYNNGVYILNDICAKLYSSTKYGKKITARSLKIEDIKAGFSNEGIERIRSSGQYDAPVTYTELNDLQYPVLYAHENGSGIGVTEEDQDKGRKIDGCDVSDEYYTTEAQLKNKPEGKEYATAGENEGEKPALTCTYTAFSVEDTDFKDPVNFYNMIFGSGIVSWLASRSVKAFESGPNFCLDCVASSTISHPDMFWSNDISLEDYGLPLRPVISLEPDIEINVDGKTGTLESPYTLGT